MKIKPGLSQTGHPAGEGEKAKNPSKTLFNIEIYKYNDLFSYVILIFLNEHDKV